MLVHDLFAIPVIVDNFDVTPELETHLKGLPVCSRFDENYDENKPEAFKIEDQFSKQNFGSHSKNLRVLRTKECEGLRNVILEKSFLILTEFLGFQVSELTDSISWVSVKSPGEMHVEHAHPNSLISGVFYFDDNLKDFPIVFSKRIRNDSFTFSVPENRIKAAESRYASPIYSIQPEKGTLVLFPSYLHHSVPQNTSDEKRYSLAFNVVPKFWAGSADNLTLLNYPDLM